MEDPGSPGAVLKQGPRPLFATLCGDRLFGLDEPDSPIEMRGAFVLSMREVLGLGQPRESIAIEYWVAHDVRKFCTLMTKRNGYVLEQLYSPLTVHSPKWHQELMHLGKGCMTSTLYYHYRGFFHNQRKLLAQPGATVKNLLHVYRIVLTGIKLLTTQTVECNVRTLGREYDVPRLTQLLERKSAPLRTGEAETHNRQLDALEQALDAAHEDCTLPEEPTTVHELSEFVYRVRLELG